MLNIREMTSEIYHLKFKSSDALALHLLRFSDYYEHIDDRLYRQKFHLSDSLEYAWKKGTDWLSRASGINLPVSIVYKMAKEYGSMLTVEERFILSLIDTIKSNQPALKYLVGTYGAEDDADDVLHELAHGFYYTDNAYKLRMDTLIRVLPKGVKAELQKKLSQEDYNPVVHDDEIQAYMATGLWDEDQRVYNKKLISMFRAPFVDVFLEAISEADLI